MARRTAHLFGDVLLIFLALIVAFYIDVKVAPPTRFVSAPYLVPVLIAAWRLSTRAAIATAILVFAVALVAVSQSGTPFVSLIFHLLGLLLASVLAILLGHLYRVSARLAREAQDARNTLDTIIETLPAGVLVSDARGIITRANSAAQTILGGRGVTGTAYGPIGGYRIECPDGTPFPGHDLPLPRAIERGEATHDVEIRVLPQEGTERVILAAGSPICDEEGRVTGAVAVFQDITERKLAEDEREQLLHEVQVERAREEAIVNSSANGIIFVDAASGIVQANPAAVQLFGHSFVPEEGQAQYLSQLLRPDGQSITLEELPSRRALKGQATVQEELVVVQPDGTRVPVLDSSAPVCLPGGQVVGAVAVLQNLTAFKQLERLREEWTSVVAHDLRQPVTVIVGYATSLLRKEANVSVEQRPKIEHILTAAQNLNKLVADLLDVSRIEARRLVLQLQPIDLPKLVSEVVERMTTADASAGNCHPIQVNVIGSIPPVLADPVRIEQVLVNLLSNAVKYGKPDGEITVTVRRQDDHALVSVTNWGPGIPPDEVKRIFSRFYRAREARDGRVAGLGLGLYITQGIVEAHHGRICVESIPNQTTTFSFTLPLASPANGRAPGLFD